MNGLLQRSEAAKRACEFTERSRSKEASWMVKSPGPGDFRGPQEKGG
jgi:hypothetical protein